MVATTPASSVFYAALMVPGAGVVDELDGLLAESLAELRAPWRELAACKDVAVETFFPSSGESTDEAKQLCTSCPVTSECLDYALEHNIAHGVWGGRTGRQRRRMRRRAHPEPSR